MLSGSLVAPRRHACLLLILSLMLALPAYTANQVGTYYAHQDHLGSRMLLTDKDGNIVQRSTYRPYGTPQSVTAKASEEQTERFTGKAFEPATGLTYFGARFYDDATARFLSADAARQTRSPYVYVAAAPLQRVDPDGNMSEENARIVLKRVAERLFDVDYRDPTLPQETRWVIQRRAIWEAGREATNRGLQADSVEAEFHQAMLTFEADSEAKNFEGEVIKEYVSRRNAGREVSNWLEYQCECVENVRHYGIADVLDSARDFAARMDVRFAPRSLRELVDWDDLLLRVEQQRSREELSDFLRRSEPDYWYYGLGSVRLGVNQSFRRIAPHDAHYLPYRAAASARRKFENVAWLHGKIVRMNKEINEWTYEEGDFLSRWFAGN